MRPTADALSTEPEPPPVVARLVVEIRSDGSRTIARGAIEDVVTGDKVALEAKGTTPAALAASLAKNLLAVPLLARQAVRNMQRGTEAAMRGSTESTSPARTEDPADADGTRDTRS